MNLDDFFSTLLLQYFLIRFQFETDYFPLYVMKKFPDLKFLYRT